MSLTNEAGGLRGFFVFTGQRQLRRTFDFTELFGRSGLFEQKSEFNTILSVFCSLTLL